MAESFLVEARESCRIIEELLNAAGMEALVKSAQSTLTLVPCPSHATCPLKISQTILIGKCGLDPLHGLLITRSVAQAATPRVVTVGDLTLITLAVE